MIQLNIQRRLTQGALNKVDRFLSRLDPPPEVENWVLYKITEVVVYKALLPAMVRWPGTGPKGLKEGQGPRLMGEGKPDGIRAWRRHRILWWKTPEEAWASGTYFIMFGTPPDKTYGVHFGKILKGDEEDSYGFVGSAVNIEVVKAPNTTIH